MIVTEYYKTRTDGVVLNRTYSDSGYMIERDGRRYSEAIDPADMGRTYTETDEKIPYDGDPNEATDSDYQAVLEEMGCSFGD